MRVSIQTDSRKHPFSSKNLASYDSVWQCLDFVVGHFTHMFAKRVYLICVRNAHCRFRLENWFTGQYLLYSFRAHERILLCFCRTTFLSHDVFVARRFCRTMFCRTTTVCLVRFWCGLCQTKPVFWFRILCYFLKKKAGVCLTQRFSLFI